jgi:hypothetical protein
VAIIHRTIWCILNCLVCQLRAQPTIGHVISGCHICPANGHQAAPDCPVCHGTRGWQRSASPNKEGNHALFTVRYAPDSLVHPWAEGNQGLPNGAPTAPRSLRAIKGTPRRMEQNTKHPLNSLRHQDTATTLKL